MSASREAIVREIIRNLRLTANMMQLVSRDICFRGADYNDPRLPAISSFSQMCNQLEQYAFDLEARLTPH
jgi:hypothetical protein